MVEPIDELELKDWILTLMIECNTNDYYRDKSNLIEKRTELRSKMFEMKCKGGKRNELE